MSSPFPIRRFFLFTVLPLFTTQTQARDYYLRSSDGIGIYDGPNAGDGLSVISGTTIGIADSPVVITNGNFGEDLDDYVRFTFNSDFSFASGDNVFFVGDKPIEILVNDDLTIPSGVTFQALTGEAGGGKGGQLNFSNIPDGGAGGAGGAGGEGGAANGFAVVGDAGEPGEDGGAGAPGENGSSAAGTDAFGSPNTGGSTIATATGGAPTALSDEGGEGGSGEVVVASLASNGGDGGNAADGSNGNPGARGAPGKYNNSANELLAGGGGSSGVSGGGGAGGQGGPGGGGGGSILVDFGIAPEDTFGGDGGNGGTGGQGGDGGLGGDGGDGAGAFRLRATGQITIGGQLIAEGEDGQSGNNGGGVVLAPVSPLPGAPTAGEDPPIARQKKGGDGAPGGNGGAGGTGGAGAGGAGGTIILEASQIDFAGGSASSRISVTGGDSGDGNALAKGENGAFFLNIIDDYGDSAATGEVVDLSSGSATLEGIIGETGDEDWFTFTLSEAATVDLFTTGSLDSFGELSRAGESAPFFSNDDSGIGLNFQINAPLAAGTYHLRIFELGNNNTGSYTLNLELSSIGQLIVTTRSDQDSTPPGSLTSLREALSVALPGQTITFDPSVFDGTNDNTITLTRGQLEISQPVLVDASALSANVTIDANGATTNHRVLQIANVTNQLDLSSLGATATQSSDIDGPGTTRFLANNAIDGNLTNFTHTQAGDLQPWLEIEFPSPQVVSSLRLHNRDNVAQERLADLLVEVLSPSPFTLPLINPGNVLNSPDFIDVAFPQPIEAQRIRITRQSPAGTPNPFLSLGEVEVFSSVLLKNLNLTGGNLTGGFPEAAGGAIYLDQTVLSLSSCQINSNTAALGGGIFNNGQTSSSSLHLSNCSVTNNTTSTGGGGLFNLGNFSGSATLTLDHCTIAENTASGDHGGGIYSNGTFSGNATLRINACTIANNSADGFTGGGIYSEKGNSSATLTLRNSILDGNSSSTAPDLGFDSSPDATLSGRNLISDLTDSGFVAGNTLLTGSAFLEPFANYGGRSLSMPPTSASPAIDAALNNDRALDQIGRMRTNGAASDLGAIEAFVFIVNTATDQLDDVTGTEVSLREAIRDTPSGGVIPISPSLSGETLTFGPSESELTIDKDLTIDASALSEGLTIDANADENNRRRVLDIASGTDVTLENLIFTGGWPADGEDGGGIRAQGDSLTLRLCTITENQTSGSGGDGGGIFNNQGSLEIDQCTISYNQTLDQGNGGGLRNNGGSLSVSRSTILGNRTAHALSQGGGISCLINSTAPASITRCTFAQNVVENDSGGAYFNHGGTSSFTTCTIVDNSAVSGGGISTLESGAMTLLLGNIIKDNQATSDDDSDDLHAHQTASNYVDFGHNLIGIVDSLITDAGQINTTSINLDPILLAPLGDYGGPTLTQPPLPGSPAIGANISTALSLDQRSLPVADGSPDIGAVELQGNEGPSIFAALWDTDLDGDGTSYGVEYMIGSDPNRSDPAAPEKLTFPLLVNGTPPDARMSFNRTTNPIPDGATLSLHRSTTLLPNSFLEVARYDASTGMTSLPAGSDDAFGILGETFLYLDANPPTPKAFYRLESEYLPPQN